MSKLKTCPFCGAQSWLHSYNGIFIKETPDKGVWGYRVECAGACHGMTCYWHTKEEAIYYWNSRT